MTKTQNNLTERSAHGSVSLDARLIRTEDGAVAVAFSESVVLNAGGSAALSLGSFHIPGLGPKPAEESAPTEALAQTDTDASLMQRMTKNLALRVASHLVVMNERITVLLAQGGDLDAATRLAINGRWSEYLEQISSIPAAPAAADNAYLFYSQGVANEALGYAATDPKATLKYLQESSIDYSRAMESKPSEKYFQAPQKRIETAIARYDRLAQSETEAAKRTQRLERPAQPAETMTNGDVVKLVKARLDKGLIANKIATVPLAAFDLSVDGLVSLAQSGVPSDLIALMTQRMQRQQGGVQTRR